MKFLFILVMVFLGAGVVSSQAQDNKAYETAVTKMLEMSKSMEVMKQMTSQITAMIKQQSGGQLNDEFLKEMETEMEAMYGRVIKAMVPVYQKYLSIEDLQGIIAFYETPVGKKLADSNTKIALETMPIAQQIGMETMQKLMAKMAEKGLAK